MEVEVEEELGNLRSTTATVYENVTLYHKSFAIIQCRSRPTIWAKYSKNKLVRAVLERKQRMKDSLLHAYVVVKTSNLVISHRRYAEYRKDPS